MDDDGYFGYEVAARYDDGTDDEFRAETIGATVDLLEQLAGDGPVLELAVGTGRLAIPLAQRGVPVHGIDLSRAMVGRLRGRPGGELVETTIGDMTTTRAPGSFALVYLVFNTIMNLVTQEAQVRCFANAASHLRPGGRFLVEVMIPELRRLPPGQTLVPFHSDAQGVGFDEYDVVHQGVVSHHIQLSDPPGRRSVPFRYVWPAELDLMATMAGMRPEERWAGWRREPFEPESESHVSVWMKVEERATPRDPAAITQ